MSCNLLAYIDEQRIACIRIAKAANEGTDAQREWLRTAQVLIDRAEEHRLTCQKCKHNT